LSQLFRDLKSSRCYVAGDLCLCFCICVHAASYFVTQLNFSNVNSRIANTMRIYWLNVNDMISLPEHNEQNPPKRAFSV